MAELAPRNRQGRPHHAALLLLAAGLLAGCPTGDGDGAVVGRFYVLGCDDTYDYGSPERPALYDMEANFFVGEPMIDDSPQPLNRLDLRLQRGGNNIEDVDSLYIQIADVRRVAQQFVRGEGSPVGPGSSVHASLSLYVTCPSFFGHLAASEPVGLSACPALDATALCEQTDFAAPVDPSVAFPPFEPQSSCLLFCRLGDLARGDEVPADFAVDFGDTLQGIFHLNLVEHRLLLSGDEVCDDGVDNDGDGTVDEPDCAPVVAGGRLMGKFNFVVRRGQVAQEFP